MSIFVLLLGLFMKVLVCLFLRLFFGFFGLAGGLAVRFVWLVTLTLGMLGAVTLSLGFDG